MQRTTITINVNKKPYCFRRLSDFCFQITAGEIPSQLACVTDFEHIWFINKKRYCALCFCERYYCYVRSQNIGGDIVARKISATQLSLKKTAPLFTALQIALVQNKVAEHVAMGELWDVASHSLEKTFTFATCETCALCSKQTTIEARCLTKKEQEHDVTAFFSRFDDNNAKDYSALLRPLETFLLQDAFGLVAYFHSYHGSGIETDIVAGRFIATMVTAFPSLSSDNGGLLLCSGQDRLEERARLKAIMEFVERYAYIQQVIRGPILQGDSRFPAVNIDMTDFITLLQPEKCSKTFLSSLYRYGIGGYDLIEKKQVRVPLLCLYDGKKHLSGVQSLILRQSGSGSAAHFSLKQAVEHALIELVERDAFMRWWLWPESAIVLAPDDDAMVSIDLIRTALKTQVGIDVAVRLLALPSPLGIPVVLALLTSNNQRIPPGLIVGAGASYTLSEACNKALIELSGGVLNFIARFSHVVPTAALSSEQFTKVKTPEDHLFLYHRPDMLKFVTFVPALLVRQPETTFNMQGPRCFNELLEKLQQKAMRCYVVDVTPKIFEPFGVCVVRCIMPGLYPLYFGYPLPFDLSGISPQSAAGKVPHCFP